MTPAQVIAHHQRLGLPVPAELEAAAQANSAAVATVEDFLQGGKRGSRHEQGRMNKTEQRHLQDIILPAVQRGELAWWAFEQCKFRLASRTWYTPDFVMQVRVDGRLVVHEVKGGHQEDDARVKVKVFAEQYRWLDVRVWVWSRGEWKVEVL